MFLLSLLISGFVVDIVVEAIVVDMFGCGKGVLFLLCLLFVVMLSGLVAFAVCGEVVAPLVIDI